MRLAIALLVLVVGCGRPVAHTGAARGTEIAVWVYETFPPEHGEPPVRFRLSAAELDQIKASIPDVSDADDHACKCGVPRCGMELYERGATTPVAEGHFFHGPDELILSFDDRDPGRLGGQRAFHDALVAVIQQRGHWK